ncbi:MAG: ATP-binding protein [Sporomusaceae bacterium]|nr:ATP-binding protein [Sporomusaceae bacterium]
MYLPEKVERIDDQYLLDKVQALIDNGVNEDRFIDYKQTLSIGLDSEKKEFCKDVSGLANANGGHIIYGIEESAGAPTRIVGFDINDPDKFKLQLQNVLNSGLQPRTPGIQIKTIEVNGPNGKYILAIGVPRSWLAPHMVIKDQEYRVYLRMNGLTDRTDIMQIKEMILEREGLAPRIRAFRQERIAWVLGEESPLPGRCGPIIIFHVIPTDAFAVEPKNDVIRQIVDTPRYGHDKLEDILDYPVNSEILPNADGVFAKYCRPDTGRTEAYCQYFRNGIVEMVNVISRAREENGKLIAQLGYPTRGVVKTFESIFKNYDELDLSDEVFIAVTILGLKGYEIEVPRGYHFFAPRLFDRQTAILPEYIANRTSGIKEILQPAMDLIWQAAGHVKQLE